MDKHRGTLDRLRGLAPQKFARAIEPKISSLPALEWRPLKAGTKVPPSRPDGGTFDVVFVNRSDQQVELFWMDLSGGRKPYALIKSGKSYRQSTRPGAVWRIADGQTAKGLGYFEVGDRSARAVVPE